MNNTDMITSIYFLVDEEIKRFGITVKAGRKGKLSRSEIVTLMIIYPILMPFCDLKRFYRMIERNYRHLFPNLPCYARIVDSFEKHKDLMYKIMQLFANPESFGLIADGTSISVMETIRGKFARSFRDARKVPCVSKREWYWGFVMVILIDQTGFLAFASIGKDSEVSQFKKIVENLKDRWILSDRGFRGREYHERFWNDNQTRIKITGGKERQWVENVIGFLKDKLGLARIRKVRKSSSFFSRVFSILCAYNTILKLNLSIS